MRCGDEYVAARCSGEVRFTVGAGQPWDVLGVFVMAGGFGWRDSSL